MPTIELSPGPWPTFRANTTYSLSPGIYPPLRIPGLPDVAIRCVTGWATIRGAVRLGDEPDCAIRAVDGCDRLLLEGLDATCESGRGIRVTQGQEARLVRCRSLGNLLEACTVAFCARAQVTNGEFGATLKQGGRWPVVVGYPPDKRHALYLSHAVDGAEVLDCTLRDVPGSGLQWNGKDGPIRNLGGQRLQLLRCGSSGTLALSLMGVVDSTLAQLYFEGNNQQDQWLGVLFSDGASGPCLRVTLKDFSPTSGRFRLENGSTATVTPGAGWSPGTVTPPIEPPPVGTPPTVEERLAALEAQGANHELRITALEAG